MDARSHLRRWTLRQRVPGHGLWKVGVDCDPEDDSMSHRCELERLVQGGKESLESRRNGARVRGVTAGSRPRSGPTTYRCGTLRGMAALWPGQARIVSFPPNEPVLAFEDEERLGPARVYMEGRTNGGGADRLTSANRSAASWPTNRSKAVLAVPYHAVSCDAAARLGSARCQRRPKLSHFRRLKMSHLGGRAVRASGPPAGIGGGGEGVWRVRG
jgi:hypothetical protein